MWNEKQSTWNQEGAVSNNDKIDSLAKWSAGEIIIVPINKDWEYFEKKHRIREWSEGAKKINWNTWECREIDNEKECSS